jgi:hypothetical protein
MRRFELVLYVIRTKLTAMTTTKSLNNLTRLVRFIHLYSRGRLAFRAAQRSGKLIGNEYAKFGHQLGMRLLLRGSRHGVQYLLTPVNIVRYFEFPFVYSCLPSQASTALDVSSPRLFSFFVNDKRPNLDLNIINPDQSDISTSHEIAESLRTRRMFFANHDLLTQSKGAGRYDCIWAISVIEHISGEYDDVIAIQRMYELLNKGGRLIITFPVDRNFREEYRGTSIYGQTVQQEEGLFFFQRFYDKQAIQDRLVSTIGVAPSVVSWFGERESGLYSAYEKEWIAQGNVVTANDPLQIVNNFKLFNDWDEMPGVGVCGMMFEKQ